MSDPKKGSENNLKDHKMFKIFNELKKNQDLKPNYLDLSKERTFALTFDNNLVYFNKETNTLGCYGLLG